jgi:hypothetical protein
MVDDDGPVQHHRLIHRVSELLRVDVKVFVQNDAPGTAPQLLEVD